MKQKPMDIGDIYSKGWDQKNHKRIELYCTILNDLAEGIHVKSRCTMPLLIETLGWLAHERYLLVHRLQDIQMDNLLKFANQAILNRN